MFCWYVVWNKVLCMKCHPTISIEFILQNFKKATLTLSVSLSSKALMLLVVKSSCVKMEKREFEREVQIIWYFYQFMTSCPSIISTLNGALHAKPLLHSVTDSVHVCLCSSVHQKHMCIHKWYPSDERAIFPVCGDETGWMSDLQAKAKRESEAV